MRKRHIQALAAASTGGNSNYTVHLTGAEPTLAPAPSTLALLALGALAAGVMRRRSRRAASC